MFGLIRSLIVLAAIIIAIGVYRGWVAFSKPNQDPNNPNVNFNVSVDKSRVQADLGKGIATIERKIQQAGLPANRQAGYGGQGGYGPNYGQTVNQQPVYGQQGYQQPNNSVYTQPNPYGNVNQNPYGNQIPYVNNAPQTGGNYGASYPPYSSQSPQANPYVNGNGGGVYVPPANSIPGPQTVPANYGDPNAGNFNGGR